MPAARPRAELPGEIFEIVPMRELDLLSSSALQGAPFRSSVAARCWATRGHGRQSAGLFGRGIARIERAFELRAIGTGAARYPIFTLSLAHDVVTFKVTALFISSIISVLGALFVLRAGHVAPRSTRVAGSSGLGTTCGSSQD